ncbi:LOW QUALITY PROTEIN: carboxylesterase 1C-like [Pecten maximus]|uniref:LOW QUALITY PROTEIN: carboxylesterase 1C-like n=1 Tax=Pecten maximus TaxID=6579 RepID=UPI001458015E|nr:LOW QUALITY PROTEIN: carboxylesterase 1C-like [Pecten maximus]
MATSLVITLFIIFSWTSLCRGEPIILTKLGEIKGIEENGVYQFRNIPYAKPPVADLRFAKPQEHEPWEGVLDGTKFGPSCLQEVPLEFKRMLPHERQSEDCLSLNVYTAGPLSTASNKSVMIWIHGGAYLFGQGMYFDASHLARAGDVIVVTFNYRLGVFGFLSSMDDKLPGNNGLWDQRLALKWVNEHISSFGGNPKSVTLFGESAGGFSVCFHALNPMNSGLFQRVIAQSGIPTSLLTLWPRAKSFSLDVGITLGCAKDTFDESYISCMRQIPAERLLSAQQQLLSVPDTSIQIELKMGPVVDGLLIPDVPFSLMTNITSPSYKFFRTLDFITGITSQDGSIAAPSLAVIAKYANFDVNNGFPTNMFFGLLFPALVSAFYGDSVKYTLSKGYVCPLYESSDMLTQANKVLDAFTDTVFLVPAISSLNSHADRNEEANTYQYVFERPHPDPLDHKRLPSWVKGSSHTSEIFFLFGIQDFFRKYTIAVDSVDLVLSEQIMKYWSNFAKHGNPNSADLPLWKKYNSDERSYISLDTMITSKSRLNPERVAMWEETLPNLLQSSSRYT